MFFRLILRETMVDNHYDQAGCEVTWSSPIRVNDDPPGNGKDQFMTHFCVDQTAHQFFGSLQEY